MPNLRHNVDHQVLDLTCPLCVDIRSVVLHLPWWQYNCCMVSIHKPSYSKLQYYAYHINYQVLSNYCYSPTGTAISTTSHFDSRRHSHLTLVNLSSLCLINIICPNCCCVRHQLSWSWTYRPMHRHFWPRLGQIYY